MTTAYQKKDNGFTLIELSVAVSIFSVLVVLATGITLSIGEIQRKSANLQEVLDNTRFGLELMTREMRTGTNFTLTPHDCINIVGNGIDFIDRNVGQRRFYFLNNNGAIKRVALNDNRELAGGECDNLAVDFSGGSEVTVNKFSILLEGNIVDRTAVPENKDGQPRITISLSVISKDPKTQLNSVMALQTTVVQRLRDR